MEPKNCASPKVKMPPSEATSQYPLVLGVAAMPTTGLLSVMPPVLPQKLASPKSKIAAVGGHEAVALAAVEVAPEAVVVGGGGGRDALRVGRR